MIRAGVLALVVATALAKPYEDQLLPGALPAISSSKYLPFREISEGRIISGNAATRGQFPWQVAMSLRSSAGTYFCSGSLISSVWVLTAANCALGAQSATISLGIVSLSDLEAITCGANRFVTHPNYDPSTLANDIALVQLDITVTTSAFVQTISLGSTTLVAGVNVVASGWGLTSDSATSISQTLNYVGLVTLDNSDCSIYYEIIQSGIVCCTGATSISQNICNGDSGGPLVTGSGANAVQVAIVSFGSSIGCSYGYPSGFTRVAAYRNWILANSGV